MAFINDIYGTTSHFLLEPNVSLVKPDDTELVISVCDEKELANTFITLSNTDNLEIDTVIKVMLQCQFCNKEFDKLKAYEGHMRVHSKDNVWTCHICSASHATRVLLREHLSNYHHIEEISQCPFCSVKFTRIKSYKEHLKRHTEPKSVRYKCDVCDKVCMKPSDLRKHQFQHNGIKEFSCSECGKKFSDVSNLNHHIKAIHEKKKLYCNACNKSFTQVASLRRHLNGRCTKHDTIANQTENNLDKNNYTQRNHGSSQNLDIQNIQSNIGRSVDALINELLVDENEIEQSQNKQKVVNEINQPARPKLTANLDIIDNNSAFDDLSNHSFGDTIDNIDIKEHNLGLNKLGEHTLENLQKIYLNASPKHVMKEDTTYSLTKNDLIIGNYDEHSIDNVFSFQSNSLNECSTIFESDVDLENGSNLAANLNQLIEGHRVDYVSNETDDTFIINLNSSIDAEQLTNMLNIGNEDQSGCNKVINKDEIALEVSNDWCLNSSYKECDLLTINESSKILYCNKCNKHFQRKENYYSHLAMHYRSLRKYKCYICKVRFAYASTRNKHIKRMHTPHILKCYKCGQCKKTFKAAWMLRDHKLKVHDCIKPFKCPDQDCIKRFSKKCDLLLHIRRKLGERPFQCTTCSRRFTQLSHLNRHKLNVQCSSLLEVKLSQDEANLIQENDNIINSYCNDVNKDLLSDIDELLKNKL